MNASNQARVVGILGLALVAACSFQSSAYDYYGSGGSSGQVPPPKPPQLGPQPAFGRTIVQADPPPPISGGTLLIAKDGSTAIAADPDRDEVSIVDLQSAQVLFKISLQLHDEPGRSAEDGAARVHVALRRGGALVTIDLKTGAIVDRQAVCAEPRGVAYDPETDQIHVACETGELVSVPAGGGAPVRTLHLERHLRDVFVSGDALLVTNYRTAKLITVDKHTGAFLDSVGPLSSAGAPTLAWRTILSPAGQPIMLHQLATVAPIDTSNDSPSGGYATNPCVSIASQAVTILPNGVSVPLPNVALAVDIALATDGRTMLVAVPGSVKTPTLPTLLQFDLPTQSPTPCGGRSPFPAIQALVGHEITSVAFDGSGRPIALSREPAALFIGTSSPTKIVLSDVSREDTGHAIFHANTGGNIACASCHGEGGDDGHTWTFIESSSGPQERRTPSLRGTVQGTAPYHWNGDMPDVAALAHTVFTQRMKGPDLMPDQIDALTSWVGSLPAPAAPAPVDPAAVQRGADLFVGAAGCAACHAGAKLTNNATVSVGTGQAFQVPSLIGVAARTPLMHNGCAATVRERFNPACGGAAHGKTASLTAGQLDDLVAYVETL